MGNRVVMAFVGLGIGIVLLGPFNTILVELVEAINNSVPMSDFESMTWNFITLAVPISIILASIAVLIRGAKDIGGSSKD